MTDPIDKDRVIVALTVFCEASSASPEERRLVVWTIFNRCRNKPMRYGKTPAGVCLMRMQYSEFNDDVIDNRNLERGAGAPDDDPVLLDCAAAYDDVRAAIRRHDPDPSGGATHYFDHSIKPPYWAAPPAQTTQTTAKFTFLAGVP